MDSQRLRKIHTVVCIAGVSYPVSNWRATLADKGSMGTATATGALSDLIDSGLDLIAACQPANGAELDIYAGYDGALDLLFSGVVDDCDMDWDEDHFEIKATDHATVLNDGKQTLAGLNYRNQSVAQIVQQIADKFGFATEITDPGTKAGVLMNGEYSYNPQPQTYWNLLQTLAENCGYECYVTADQVLYFGPETEQGSFTVHYGATRDNPDAKIPAWGLKVQYQPRNNSNIVVKAVSVDPQSRQPVTGSATAQPVATGKGRKTRSSITSKTTKVNYPSKGRSGSRALPKSVHYIRCPGMTPEQAQERCQAVADNLAKHQIILSFQVEGLASLKIHSEITMVEDTIDLYDFDGIPLNVAEVTHSYDDAGGLVSSVRALAQVAD